MAEESPDDHIFRKKEQEIVWGPIVEEKESKLIEKLLDADKNGPADVLKTLVDQVESKFESLVTCKINASDVDYTPENLEYLFHLSQCVMEIKDSRIVEAKEKLKKQKESKKEMEDHMSQQDDEIDRLNNELKKALSSSIQKPGRLQEGEGVDPAVLRRKEQEIKTLQQDRDLLKEEILTLKREAKDQKDAVAEAQRKISEQSHQISMLNTELTALTRQNEELSQTVEAEATKQRQARQQNQKTSKEALKFVHEVRELSMKVEELENEREQRKIEISEMTDEILRLRDDLKDVTDDLESTKRARDEVNADNISLREKVAELTVAEERNTEQHDQFMQEIKKRVRTLKEENAKYKADLDVRELELKDAKDSIARLEQEKRQSEAERRFTELKSELDRVQAQRTADLDEILKIQRENAEQRRRIRRLEEDMKKQQKRLQAQYKEKENEVRAFFYERQEEMVKTEKTNAEFRTRMAELEDEKIGQEQHIAELYNGTFGLTEAMGKVKELKRELDVMSNRMSERTKGFNEALRKIEDLHEEVRMLRDHLVKVDPELRQTAGKIGFQAVSGEDNGSELDWVGFKDGFRLDITAYKVRTAMELEKAKAMNLQLEREVETLETERLEMKSQLRLLSLQKGERAAKLGLTAADIERLDAFAEYLKSGDIVPFDFGGQTPAEANQTRKLSQKLVKLEKDLKEKEEELARAMEAVGKLKDDTKGAAGMQSAVEEMRALVLSFYSEAPDDQPQLLAGGGGAAGFSAAAQGTPQPPRTPQFRTPFGLGASRRGGLGEQGMVGLTPQVYDQLAKALREGELADQAQVDVGLKAVRHLPAIQGPAIYAVASISRASASSKSYRLPPGPSGHTVLLGKEEQHRLPVGNRSSDVVTVCLYEALEEDRQDRAKDRLIGENQVSIDSWARGSEKLWNGTTEMWLVMQDEFGKPVQGLSKQKCEVQVQLKFVETPSRKAQALEEQLEAVKGVSRFTAQRLETCERDLASLREDLTRKSEDLEEALAERNKLRQELQRTRLNSGFDLSRTAGALKHLSSKQDGRVLEDDSAEAGEQTDLITRMSDLNAHLIESLDALAKREEEAVALEGELKRYEDDMETLRVQQVLLYKEHVERVGELEREVRKHKKELADAVSRGDTEAKKALTAAQKLGDLSRASAGDELRTMAVEAERKSIVLEAERDELQRCSEVFRQELSEVRDRYDALVLDTARQQHRLKQRIGRLDRDKAAAERRLTKKERQLERTVGREDHDRLRQEYIALKEKHAVVVNEGSKALLQQAAIQGQEQRLQKLTREKEELEVKLSEASDRASALSSRLEALALKDGPPEGNLLAAMSEKLVKLEVSERNFCRRYDLCMERLRGAEQERRRMEERIAALEGETVEQAVAVQRLQETERDLAAKLQRTISAEEAAKLRAQIARQDEEIAELKSTSQKYEEMAELATDQAKAMEELQSVHKHELEALRSFLSQVQSESEDAAELGLLHRKVMDRDRQIMETDSKVLNMDRELVRLDAYVVRLEEGLERKNEELFRVIDLSMTESKKLESAVEDLRARAAGQIPLDKVDEWASSLRDLTEQKKAAEEELAATRKGKGEVQERADKLQIQLEEQRRLAAQLREEMLTIQRNDPADPAAARAVASAERLGTQAEELTKYRIESLRLSRQVKQLQERETHLERSCQTAEKELRAAEEALVQARAQAEAQSHDAHQDLLAQLAAAQRRNKELEAGPLSSKPPARYTSAFAAPAGGGDAAPRRRQSAAVTMPLSESRALDVESVSALSEQVGRLTEALRERDERVEQLEAEIAKLTAAALRPGGGGGDGEGSDGTKLAVAAEHTQEVARLTIERLEKNNERKSGLIHKYQEQLRAAREEYMHQKELDAATIEDLRQKLAAKSNESIHHMRNRLQGSQGSLPVSGPPADTDAVFAEKDKLIKGLSDELQEAREKVEAVNKELGERVKEWGQRVEEKEGEIEALRREVASLKEEKPSQKLETLVFKLKKQLKDKETTQHEMKKAIESLKEEMIKAADKQASSHAAYVGGAAGGAQEAELVTKLSATLQADMEKLKGKLERMKGEQARVKKEVEAEREAKEGSMKEVDDVRADKSKVEAELARVNKELKKAVKDRKEALDALKALEAGAAADTKRIEDMERQVRDTDRAAGGRVGRGGVGGGGLGDGRGVDIDKEKAMRRWEAEKRLEAKVEELREKLREQRKDIDAMEKQHAADLERSGREGERLRQQVERLEQDKRTLREQLRGGEGVDSEELLKRVRDAERSHFEVQEANEKLRQALEVEQREKEGAYKARVAGLEREVKGLREEKDALAQQLQRLAADGGALDQEMQRVLRRAEAEVARLREREEELDKELLAAQNQVLRLRFEEEHAALKLQRWRRRVRELESLPLAAGRAVPPDVGGAGAAGGGGKAGGGGRGGRGGGGGGVAGDEEEVDRFVRSTKAAMEKLQRENEALKAGSASNIKYMEVVKENKVLRANLADRDSEIVSLTERLGRAKELGDRRGRVEEKVYSLERQLKDESDKVDDLSNRLRDRDRQVSRLEADLRAAREIGAAAGGGGAGGQGAGAANAAQLAAELEAVEGRLRAAERLRVEAEGEVSALRRELSAANKRAADLEAQVLSRPAAPPAAAAATTAVSGADSADVRRLREEVVKLQQENQSLHAELDSFDPDFFDEIEDLKYSHNEMTKLVDKYEVLLQQLSVRYSFEYNPFPTAQRPPRPART